MIIDIVDSTGTVILSVYDSKSEKKNVKTESKEELLEVLREMNRAGESLV